MTEELAASKRQIVLAAERMFATEGLAVSLRQIGFAAGHANKSAVHYHFGTKDDLLKAIFEYRLEDLQDRRDELAAQRGLDTVRDWLECHLRAVLELAERPDSYYLRFLTALDIKLAGAANADVRRPELGERVRAFHARLVSLMDPIAEPLRTHRINNAEDLMLRVGARREWACQAGLRVLPIDAEVADLVYSLSGFLEAPISMRALSATQR